LDPDAEGGEKNVERLENVMKNVMKMMNILELKLMEMMKHMEKMMENDERKWLEGVSCSPGVFTFLPVRKLLDYQ
jgi:hypothetical protein